MLRKTVALLKLTKPTIVMLVLVTGAAALVMEGHFVRQPRNFLLVMIGLFLTGGAANALNQYFERNRDANMTRTSRKRPLPAGTVTPGEALAFSIVTMVAGLLLFGFCFNWLSAGLALATIVFYSFFYTLWLKPRTHLNIVIGGAAGAMGPIIAWAAATNSLAMAPWVLFLIIFFWTPPHFWALAMCLKEDYRRVGLPMLPVVRGDRETIRQIMGYTLILVGVSLSLLLFGAGTIYLVLAALLGFGFVALVARLQRENTTRRAWGVFGYSIIYLFLLFIGVMVDAAWSLH